MLANEYKVAVSTFPSPIRPENAKYLETIYILRQLHETLFVKAQKGIDSTILKNGMPMKIIHSMSFVLKKTFYFLMESC